jgi:signal transduction histidine kinase/ActR/RegA family two-component response regulator
MATGSPIRRTLMTVILLTCGAVMLTTSIAYCVYDLLAFRRQTLQNLTTLNSAIATNVTAALAFENADDAREILRAFKTDPHVKAALLYSRNGSLFASYPADTTDTAAVPFTDGYRFDGGFLIGVQPVVENEHRLGTLYVRSDLSALTTRLGNFAVISGLVLLLSCAVAYLVSLRLQRQISDPILNLTATVASISESRDYNLRAPPASGQEVGRLTEAFNGMLGRVESAQTRLQSQLRRLDLLHRITRAIGERQDLASIFLVVLRSLEDELPIDFGCVCLYDATADSGSLSLATLGARSRDLAAALGLDEGARVPIDQNGLARCVGGQLVYEPEVAEIPFPFPTRFAAAGLHSLVLAPLLVEARVFGVVVVARRGPQAFSSAECEFLRHLSEHVALAAHQARLVEQLQRAYDDLRQSQQAVNYLKTIQTAIDDVAETVARMREFYRPREPELNLVRVNLNRLVEQVIELTRARWSDVPLQKGIMIRLHPELDEHLPMIMGSEGEIRDALTNLIFNAVDAMPEGGSLTLRTRNVDASPRENLEARVMVEVTDTGIGMDEQTRRRCLEPFYTTKGERGTGLGLAMVYGMVQRHSAELDIESAVGKGTTVRVAFATMQTALPVDSHRPENAPAVASLRLLLVDDDPLIIKTVQEVLESDGHTVVTADGGENGINAFLAARVRGMRFDAVITDLGMPYVDGRRVAAAIKGASPQTPVIMLTGWGRRMVAENETPPHVDRVLSKPPKLAELRSALAELTRPLSPSGRKSTEVS